MVFLLVPFFSLFWFTQFLSEEVSWLKYLKYEIDSPLMPPFIALWELKFLSESVSYSFPYTQLNSAYSRSIRQHKTQKCRGADTGWHPWRSSSPTSCSNRIAEAVIGHWRLSPLEFWLSLKIPQTPWSSHTSFLTTLRGKHFCYFSCVHCTLT